jgi:hypothetical protein
MLHACDASSCPPCIAYLVTFFAREKHFVAGLPNRRTIVAATAALIGAVNGIFLAWLLKATGHPPWSVLLIIFAQSHPA